MPSLTLAVPVVPKLLHGVKISLLRVRVKHVDHFVAAADLHRRTIIGLLTGAFRMQNNGEIAAF